MTIIRNSKESEIVEYFNTTGSKFFSIRNEVTGIHVTGRKKRIDAVIYPKDILIEKDFPNIPIGIEFKTSNLEDGNKKQIIELYHQAIQYRHTRFDLNGGINFLPLILIYPPMMNYLNHATNVTDEFNRGFKYFAQRLSGLFFIGELFLERDNQKFDLLIELCGTEYYRLYKSGYHHRYSSNWGFEIFEREIGKLVSQKLLSVEEYEKEVLSLSARLGI